MAPTVLSDIRVIDLGRYVAAPYCGLILADLGAEVIRIDRPGGEDDRRIGLIGPHGENFVYPALARNKRGITLDVRHPQGRALLLSLVGRSDVFLHNFSPGAARDLRVTYDEVRAARPDIIYTQISCFGDEGPDADRPGFDPIAQVVSGGAAVTGLEGEPPLRSGVPWVDYSTGLSAALGTVAALRHRDRTGEGQVVSCALLRTAVSYMAALIGEAVAGTPRPRLGNRAAYLGPTDLYPCRDGLVYVACATEAAWRALMQVVGRPDLIADPRLTTHVARFEHRAWLDQIVRRWMADHSIGEVVRVLGERHVPCGVCHSPAEVPANPQVQACRMLPVVDLDVPGMRPVAASAAPVVFSHLPSTPPRRPPRVGEDSEAIYTELLGLSPVDIADFRNQRVI